VKEEEGAFGSAGSNVVAGRHDLMDEELRELEQLHSGTQTGTQKEDAAIASGVRDAAQKLAAVGSSLQRAIRAAPSKFGQQEKDLAVLLAQAGELEPEIAEDLVSSNVAGSSIPRHVGGKSSSLGASSEAPTDPAIEEGDGDGDGEREARGNKLSPQE